VTSTDFENCQFKSTHFQFPQTVTAMSKARRFGISEEESSPVTDHELDWSYTARCTKEWSDDELLSYLCSNAFTIPPRDYNPSAPFVYVRSEDGVTTTLPHGYRLPLMFIAKYQWETTTRTLSLHNRQRWDAVRDEIFHLSRLCHVLLSKARAKAESNVMEKGWRCVMFDRVLTRFYKGWPVSSPPKLESFLSHFSLKEYERDILKYGTSPSSSILLLISYRCWHNSRLEKMGIKRFLSFNIITHHSPHRRGCQ